MAKTGGLALRDRRALIRQEQAALPQLLEFHSPSAALAVTPVIRGARAVNAVVCSLVGACFLAGALIPVDKVVTAQGKVISVDATNVVQPLETSIVRSIDVREGQSVRKGALLARLDPTFATADASASEALVSSLQAEVDRLTAESHGVSYSPRSADPAALLQTAIYAQRRAEYGYKMEGYSQKISGLRARVQSAMTDVAGYAQRLAVARDVEQKRAELERLAVGSKLNLLAATDNRLEVQRGLDGAQALLQQSSRDLAALEAERDGYDKSWHNQVNQDLTEQGRKLSDARENFAKASRRRQLVELRAEQDSVVLNIARVSVGSVLQPGEQLMSLTPSDAKLEVEVNVSGSDAGFVHPGNPVTIKFDSFPSTQYGNAEGEVRYLSPDSFIGNPEERQRGVQQTPQTGTSYFRARVTIDDVQLHDTPSGFVMQPGMPVTADVKVGKRTVLSYLLSRVLPVALDGMREP